MKVTTFWEDSVSLILKVTIFLATGVSQGAATSVWLAVTCEGEVVGEEEHRGYWHRSTRPLSNVGLMS